MPIRVHIVPGEALSLRDPQASDLGRRLISGAITLLDRIGLEDFTFKKLAAEVECTEASVYRYFQNKHQLLLYLVNWYWEWVRYLLVRASEAHVQPRERLFAAVAALAQPMVPNPDVTYVDERILHRIVVTEGPKAYHGKQADADNRTGAFAAYKQLIALLGELIAAVDPAFPYPIAAATTLFDLAHSHVYYAEHLPRLTDLKASATLRSQLEDMLVFWMERLLNDVSAARTGTSIPRYAKS